MVKQAGSRRPERSRLPGPAGDDRRSSARSAIGKGPAGRGAGAAWRAEGRQGAGVQYDSRGEVGSREEGGKGPLGQEVESRLTMRQKHAINNSMTTTPLNLNDPNTVVPRCDLALRAIRDALNYGVQVAYSIEDTWFGKMPRDPCLWSYNVRSGACSHLAEMPPSDTWGLGRRLSLAGIEVKCRPFLIKVWKSRDSNPPPPGDSQARNNFCRQLSLDLGDSGGTNLIVDWSLGAADEVVLALSRPNGAWAYRQTPTLEWRSTIEFPAGSGLAFPTATELGVLAERVIDQADLRAAGENT